MSDSTLDRIRNERIAKTEALSEIGWFPYANDFQVSDSFSALRERYEHLKTGDELPEDAPRHQVAGRIVARRVMGKLSFFKIRDGSGEMQLMIRKDLVGEESYGALKKLNDVGDFVGASGPVMRTRTGELSILVHEIRIITKSIRPMPEKWHGLTDTETRFRQRYLDLVMNQDVRKIFETRAGIVRFIRNFLDERGFLEVETPMLQTLAGGAAARPFETFHNAHGMPMFLRIAPELYLKRLVVGGFERVFELNRNFRNEGMSHWHNPEFTMVEFYCAYATYEDLIDLSEEMLSEMANEVCSSSTLTWRDQEISFERPFARMTIREAIRHYLDNPELKLESAEDIIPLLKEHSIEIPKPADYGRTLMALYEGVAEHQLIQPTFITEFPIEVSPLARKNVDDPRFVDRFELIIGGKEVANAFSELNDPMDQKQRFEAQVAAKNSGDDEAHEMDEDYIRALEVGMPPAAGEGIGIDRLVMLMTNQDNIREVILFPHMRPEQGMESTQEVKDEKTLDQTESHEG